jgi:NADP-dependent 3-hydroxy acid dehydrogenase YdfG
LLYPHNINSDKRPLGEGPERDEFLEPENIAALVAFVCAAPEHVAIGNATIWPIRAGIRTVTGAG